MYHIATILHAKHPELFDKHLPYLEEIDVTLLGGKRAYCRQSEKAWPRFKPTYVGSTGWLWKQSKLLYLTGDIDLRGDGHAPTVGISESDMQEAQAILSTTPYIELHRSTSGNGLHFRAWLDLETSPTVTDRKQIGPLAKQLWAKICTDTGSDLLARQNTVDKLGCSLWFGSSLAGEDGFELLSPQKHLLDWATVAALTPSEPKDILEEFESDHPRVPLDVDHKLHIASLSHGVWDSTLHMLRGHTMEWSKLHMHLHLKGVFQTSSPGTNTSMANCFAFPVKDGAWIVYAWAGSEAPTWAHRGKYPFTYVNRQLSLDQAARMYGASQRGTTYSFPAGQAILDMVQHYPGTELPTINETTGPARIKVDGKRLLLGTKPEKVWVDTPLRLKGLGVEANPCDELGPLVRCLQDGNRKPVGWAVYIEDSQLWSGKQASSIECILGAIGAKNPGTTKGHLEKKPWTLVSIPFASEYPDGLRLWNCESAQLRHQPIEHDGTCHPLWDKLLKHFAGALDAPLKAMSNPMLPDGRTYMMAWFAYCVRNPRQRLPYLFAHGSQDCGKSTIVEAFQNTVLNGGHCSGERAVQSEFNGELDGTVFVVCDDTKFNKVEGDKLKDLVTGPALKIRRMRTNAFEVPNYTHWIHLANDADACPQFSGDRRVVDILVPDLTLRLNKEQLMEDLMREGPYFTHTLLNLELPNEGRFALPLVETDSKKLIMEQSVSPALIFLRENTKRSPDSKIMLTDLIKAAHRFAVVADRKEMATACIAHELTILSDRDKVQFVHGVKL